MVFWDQEYGPKQPLIIYSLEMLFEIGRIDVENRHYG